MGAFKSLIVGLAMAFALAPSLHAEALFSVSADIPVAFSFDESSIETDGMPSGTMFAAKLPILVGVGYESYEVPMKADYDLKVDATFYDIFYQLPIPLINVTLGLGAGTLEYKCTYMNICDSFDKANATQTIVSVGFPVMPFFDVHVGYRKISASLKNNITNTSSDFGGAATSLGVSFGF